MRLQRNSLYFSLLAGNSSGEGFARDCILRHLVPSAEKPCAMALNIGDNNRNSAYFALNPDSENVSCQSSWARFEALFSKGLTVGPV